MARATRPSVTVATKGGVVRPDGRWESDASPAQLRAACERSLRALGVDRLALYQLHAPDPKVPFAESVGELARLREEGKIRWVGLSNVSVAQIREAQAIVPITSVQNRLNPFFRESLTERCRRVLRGAGDRLPGLQPDRRRPAQPQAAEPSGARGDRRRLGVSAHAVVLAWVLAQSPTVIVIPSARKVEHALDSVGAAELELPADDLAAIDGAEFSRA